MNSTPPPGIRVDTYSTATVPLHQRVRYWNALSRKTYTPVTANPLDGCQFEATLTYMDLGEIRFGQVTSTASVVDHSRQQATRIRRRSLFLQMQLRGESVHRQDGREAFLHPGDLTLLDSSRPYTSRFPGQHDMLVVGLPEHLARRIVGHPQAVTCLAMRSNCGTNDLLGVFLGAFWNECRNSLSRSSAPHLTAAMLHMIQAALVAVPPAANTARDAQTNKYLRAIDFIEARLCEQSLSASTIAAACNISPRHLHRLFAVSDETVSGYISRRRLEGCAALLQSPLHRRRTFSSIAADWGFQTLTGFGKAFRQRYGMTLSEYRRQSSASGQMATASLHVTSSQS